MNTLIVTEVRIYSDGINYYCSESFYKIIERYSKKFGKLSIYTRIIKSEKPSSYIKINLENIEYVNSKSIISSIMPFKKGNIKQKVKKCDFIILRVPSISSIYIYHLIKKYKKKYMIEAMGCAWDAYWNHDIKGKIIAPIGFIAMKIIVFNANYATYVTKKFLQKRYPCKNESIGVSNVNISKTYKHKDYKIINKTEFSLLTAAAVDVRYKGQQYVIEAIAKLKNEGYNIKYYLAGGGNQDYLKKISIKHNIEDQIIFLGNLKHEELIKLMQEVDFYIQPSLQEGLPRSVIEAMSCGCVCLGSKTAGIPELINKNQIFKRRNVNSIVETIKNTLNLNLNQISKENEENAKNYLSTILNKKRFDFYEMIVKETR